MGGKLDIYILFFKRAMEEEQLIKVLFGLNFQFICALVIIIAKAKVYNCFVLCVYYECTNPAVHHI